MQVGQFLRAVRFVLHVEQGDGIRPYDGVVAFDFQADALTLVTTDGRRMAVVELATGWGAEPKVLCVTRESLEAAVSQLGEATGALCFFPMAANELGAVSENCVIGPIPLSEVDFPDWSRCTRPEPTGTPELWVPAGQWAAAFTALRGYQDEHDTVRVQVAGRHQAVKISSADEKAYAMIMPCMEPR